MTVSAKLALAVGVVALVTPRGYQMQVQQIPETRVLMINGADEPVVFYLSPVDASDNWTPYRLEVAEDRILPGWDCRSCNFRIDTQTRDGRALTSAYVLEGGGRYRVHWTGEKYDLERVAHDSQDHDR